MEVSAEAGVALYPYPTGYRMRGGNALEFVAEGLNSPVKDSTDNVRGYTKMNLIEYALRKRGVDKIDVSRSLSQNTSIFIGPPKSFRYLLHYCR